MSQASPRKLTIMVVPDGGRDSRTFNIPYRWLRLMAGGVSLLALALTVMAGSWWYLAARASRVSELELEFEATVGDRARVQMLGRRLEEIEAQYGKIRALFGSSLSGTSSDVWLPPATSSGRGRGAETLPAAGASAPSMWPLTERGFITQALLEGAQGDHPGLDIAVPSDSYIRAAGGGTVVDVDEDDVYGRFVVIDHGGGYSTLYAHASLHLVARGQRVRAREVVALTGSTGRSTAPHLHFEILLNGEAVDPLLLVQQPT
ncbi:MAG: M23 family metallopeptidase [Gemmatimonadetes bacterium]|nr:M23 family metallopeptidase [Gemmatimonadota bacterium]